ncbi:hypothetical protein LTR78_003822 [Recurvomyces mirabilis]|uniref:Uncharacterized protein n=1 Tax=Recurvomyces mirabilis TaxID=574656 RepID=A0AAE0WRF7_9PEZI|nr:hypothetical protein LTR78_003822 [Recurvomyces mirabilis]KAK5154934.1 hypothetical protein LTS14_006515 [Recurvomyces mirabilis]
MTTATIPSVAVIGLGAFGLVTVKNLLEEGFDVTGFDRNSSVGGLWSLSPEATVSALSSTSVNVSRERGCFTDFPFPDETGSYPTAGEVKKYLNDYCSHFNLWPNLHLQTSIAGIQRDEEARKWRLNVVRKGGIIEKLSFDKLVIATGPQNVPVIPDIPNANVFKGTITHSATFKDPTKFAGKNVVVLGIGNSAVDTSTSLIGHANKIYLAHRSGCLLLPRILNDGTSLDHAATYRTFAIRDFLETFVPQLAARFIDNMVATIQKTHYDFDPQWRIDTPTPSLTKRNPTVSYFIYDALREEKVISTHGIKRYAGPRSLEMDDGTVLEDVDAVVYCTGYQLELSWLGKYDPTVINPDTADEKQHDYAAPRLYQNIISHDQPDSLAFIGLALTIFPAFVIADLSAMALAQMWSKPELLPSDHEMQDRLAKHKAWRARVNVMANPAGKGPPPLQVETGHFLAWVQDVAGTWVNEHLSYNSLAAWILWWQDRELSKVLMDGVNSPHSYRLFDSHGRRKAWGGARDAVFHVNEEVKRRVEARKADGKVKIISGGVIAHS